MNFTNTSPDSLKFTSKRTKEKGNVFFYILVAIALFAALSYAISNNRGGNVDIFEDESAKIAAQEIIEYGNKVANAVQKLRLRGCSDTDISFENNVVTGYTNGTNTACQVFHVDGGNIQYRTFEDNFLDVAQNAQDLYSETFFPDHVCLLDIGSGASGCNADSIDNESLILIVPYVKRAICEQLNLYTIGDSTIHRDSGAAWENTNDKFTGTYKDGTSIHDTGPGNIAGKLSQCIEGGTNPATGTFHYYQVLIPR